MINVGGFMIIKEKMKSINQRYFNQKFKTVYNKLVAKGIIKPFDDEFYSQFDGMLYNVIPVEFYLKKMSMGKCYDASVVLGLAFGRREDTYICRGNCKYAGLSINGTTHFGHSWVERDDMVYDTTWQICLPKKVYYKLYGVTVYDRRTTKQFFEDCEKLSDFHIHDKSYYENNFAQFAYCTLIQMKATEKMLLDSKSERNRKLGEKMSRFLPDFDKVNEQYEKSKDDMFRKLSESPEEITI